MNDQTRALKYLFFELMLLSRWLAVIYPLTELNAIVINADVARELEQVIQIDQQFPVMPETLDEYWVSKLGFRAVFNKNGSIAGSHRIRLGIAADR